MKINAEGIGTRAETNGKRGKSQVDVKPITRILEVREITCPAKIDIEEDA
jgi:hypothetical protein